jgi:hypothetical protein
VPHPALAGGGFRLRLGGLEISEPNLFFGGTLVCEWLTATNEGLAVYKELFSSAKKAIGVMKSLKTDALDRLSP